MTNPLQPLIDRVAPGWFQEIGVPTEWIPDLLALDQALAALDPDYLIFQVKTKFGGLRYYAATSIDATRSEFGALITATERKLYQS